MTNLFATERFFQTVFFSWTNRPSNRSKRMCKPGERSCFGVGSHIEVAQVRDFRPKIRFFCSSGSNTEVERDQWDSFRGAARLDSSAERSETKRMPTR